VSTRPLAQFSFSNNGSLAYIPGPVSTSGTSDLALGVSSVEAAIEKENKETDELNVQELEQPPRITGVAVHRKLMVLFPQSRRIKIRFRTSERLRRLWTLLSLVGSSAVA
jgi:hypothetical protein